MFHQRNGLFFDRQQNGDMRIVKTYDGRGPRPDNVVLDHTMTQSEFASIVAYGTPMGETTETYHTALGFLQAGK